MNKQPKLLKVTMEFEDEISELTGAEAEMWYKWVNSALAVYQTRGWASNPELNFKVTQKSKEEKS